MSLPAGRCVSGQVLSASLAAGVGECLLAPSIVCRSNIVLPALALRTPSRQPAISQGLCSLTMLLPALREGKRVQYYLKSPSSSKHPGLSMLEAEVGMLLCSPSSHVSRAGWPSRGCR